jgi:hypothetical protein
VPTGFAVLLLLLSVVDFFHLCQTKEGRILCYKCLTDLAKFGQVLSVRVGFVANFIVVSDILPKPCHAINANTFWGSLSLVSHNPKLWKMPITTRKTNHFGYTIFTKNLTIYIPIHNNLAENS